MNKLLVSTLSMALLLGGIGVYNKYTENKSKIKTVTKVQLNESGLYINGQKYNDTSNVITYKKDLYISLDVLKSAVSDYFIQIKNDEYYIRNISIKKDDLIQYNEATYVSYDLLSTFVHINHSVMDYSKDIYIDTSLDQTVNIKGNKYNKSYEVIDVPPVEEFVITKDGRYAYIDDQNCYIQDDQDKYVKYIPDTLEVA